MDKAVILARGVGSRMRRMDEEAQLSQEQSQVADAGIKAMIPIDRPFLDYVLHNLAEAGYRRICLVIGPEHEAVRQYYGQTIKPQRLTIDFGIQNEPLGTANAVLAAEAFAEADPFLVINSDNYYPLEALRGLRQLDGPGLAAFERKSMLVGGNIPADRLTKFAVVQTDDRGYMIKIIEKPDRKTLEALPEPICLSMNCWRFNASIFSACHAISPSSRGELELPDAVQHTMSAMSECYTALAVRAPVLDLSQRSDIASVSESLIGREVRL